MINVLVRYRVGKDRIETAKSVVKEFANNIKKKEKKTEFKSFQIDRKGNEFVHILSFKDEKAEEAHRHAPYAKDFMKKLAPLCENKPVFIKLKDF